MFKFLLNMWVQRRVTETQINSFIGKAITADEAAEILTIPQISIDLDA